MLQILNLTNSGFSSLKILENSNSFNLKYLILKKTKIYQLKNEEFKNLKKLIYLDLSNLHIKKIGKQAIFALKNVEIIDITNGYFELEQSSLLIKSLLKLKKLISEQFKLCCFCTKYLKQKHVCIPKEDHFLTCHNIFPNIYLKILFWFCGIFGIFANIFAFQSVKKNTSLSNSKFYHMNISLDRKSVV